MSEGWDVRPLGELCTIKPPKAEARSKLRDVDPVSFVPMEDLGVGAKSLIPSRTRSLGEVSGSYTYFADGDVLLAKITPCFENGKLGVARGLVNGIGFGSSEFIVLRPGPELEAEFLYYYLARPSFLEEGARSMTGAVGHKRVAKEFIEAYPVPLPSRSEQRRIVAILDEAFEGIATAKDHAERNLRNAAEVVEVLKDACFGELRAGGVRQVRLAEVARFRNGVNYTKESRGQEVLVIGVKDFQSKFWAPLDSLDRVTLDGPLHEADQLNEGDIVFVRSNGNPALIGRCLLVGPVGEQTTHSGFTIKMRLMDKCIRPAYVCHFLKSGRIRRQLVDGGNGANIKSLNQGTLSAIAVPVPAMSVQQCVIERVNRLIEERDRIDALYQRKLAALDELKQSLLHQAFSGQL